MTHLAYIPTGAGTVPPAPPAPKDLSNPVIGKCPKCGLELRTAMWYACNKNPCPAGLGSKYTL